ncbi:GAF domain-containing protein [Pleurocapsales cyanobacterium LEGE 10410]|nr:GAF domain-containing protein [Pleurocapsales cyanobacterium LEGE 10410]
MTSRLSLIELQQENYRLQVELTELRSRYESLQKSETRYRQIFENAPISMLCISTEGKPIEMNSAAEQFLGWTIADANEAGFNGFTNPTLVENGTIVSINRAIAGETVIEPPMSFEPSSTIGQGQWKWAQGYYYPIRDAAGQVQEVVEVALDPTAMYEVQQKLDRERTSLLQASAQVANLLLKASDYTTVLPDVVKLLGEAVGSDRCTVMQDLGLHSTLNLPALKIIAEWCQSDVSPCNKLTPPADEAYLWSDVPEAYETLVQGKVFNCLVANLQEPGKSLMQAQGNTSCLFVPILIRDRLWGIFGFDNCGEPRLYDEAEIAILQIAAENIAAAIARQAKDEELRKSERRYRQLMDLAGEGIFRVEYEQPISVDLPVKEQAKQIYQQFRYAEHNLAFAQMYGYDQADALVGTYLAHVTDAPENAIQMETFVQNGHRMRNQETVEIDRFGNKRYFLNNGFSIIRDGLATGGWGTQIDITELRETQQALLEAEQERSQQLEKLNLELQQTLERLSESEERYRTLFELSSEGILRFGYHQPIPLSLSVDEQLELCYQSVYIVEANDAYAKMFEYEKAKDMIGLTLNDVHDRNSEVTQITMREWIENRYTCHQSETVEFDRHGHKRYFNSSVSTIENDCVTSTWVSQVDITELREAQQAILKAEQERSQQLESLNLELQQTVNNLETRDRQLQQSYRILEATAKASNVLLTGNNLDEAVNQALQIIGESIDTDRIGIAKNWNNPSKPSIPHWRALYEWSSPQTIPQFSHPKLTQGSYEGIEQWYELNRIGKTICRQLEEIPEPFRSVQAKLGVKTFYSVPIFIEDKWWGAIGFDDCREETHRSEAELSIVKTAAACIGSAIERDRTQKATLKAEQERCLRLASQSQQLESLNIELQQTLDDLEARDRILSTTATATNTLLTTENLDEAINTALQTMGESLETDRIKVLENFFDEPSDRLSGYHNVIYEWTRPNTVCQMTHQAGQISTKGLSSFMEALLLNNGFGGLVDEWIEPLRSAFKALEVKSSYCVPIRVEDEWWGVLAFDDCREAKRRSQGELAVLNTVADCIGSAIERDRTQKATLKAEQERCLRLASQSRELERINTELQQTLKRLSESEERYRTLFEISSEGIVRTEFDAPISVTLPINEQVELASRHLYIAEVNPAFAAMYGYKKPEDVVGLRLANFYGGDLEKGKAFLRAQIENGYRIRNVETEETDGNGRKLYFLNNTACTLKDGCLISGWGTQIDITELRQAQQALLQAERERVAELAKANQALKNSLDRLAADPSLDSFLNQVLLEISQQLNIHTAFLWIHNPTTRTLELHNWIEKGKIQSHHSFTYLKPLAEPILVENTAIWQQLLGTKYPFVITQDNATRWMFPGTEDWQLQWAKRHGIQSGINVILMLGDTPLGLLCLMSSHRSEFTSEELELTQAISQQATLAIQLTNLAEEAKQSAIFEERNRLAGEIHDTLAQTFTGISVQLELAQYLSQNNPAEVAAILDRIGSLAQTGLAEARRSVWSVYPATEDYADLAQKLTDCVTTLTEGTDLETQVRITGDSYPLSYFVSKNLLRIGQESITNTLKHARATILLVELIYTPDRVSLRVRDNGCGFSPQVQTEGFGLAGISERSDRINGQLRIITQPGEGTEIFVQVSL